MNVNGNYPNLRPDFINSQEQMNCADVVQPFLLYTTFVISNQINIMLILNSSFPNRVNDYIKVLV